MISQFQSTAEASAHVRKISGGSVATSPLPDPIRVSLAGVDFIEPEDLPEARVGLSFALAGIALAGSLPPEPSDTPGRSATALPLMILGEKAGTRWSIPQLFWRYARGNSTPPCLEHAAITRVK